MYYISPHHIPIHNLIKYNLPDGFWQYSFSSSILLIWQNHPNKVKKLWFGIVAITGIAAEIAQYSKILPGTFDPIDLVFFSLGAIIPYFTLKK